MAKQKTSKEIFQEKQDFFDLEKLLEPYSKGGTREIPVKRTVGTMMDYLVNKKKYSVEVAGAAIFLVLMEVKNGRVFKGDETYGSKGRQLITYIRTLCDQINQRNLQQRLWQQMAQANLSEVTGFIKAEIQYNSLPMPLRLFAPSRWHWWLRRKAKKNESA